MMLSSKTISVNLFSAFRYEYGKNTGGNLSCERSYSGAFTEKGLLLLKLLAGQMAISIENALFYNELENKVKERTNELQIEKKKSDDLLLNILPEDVATN